MNAVADQYVVSHGKSGAVGVFARNRATVLAFYVFDFTPG